MMFKCITRSMTPAERHEWMKEQGRISAARRDAGFIDATDMGPDIKSPKGKMRCHGIRRKMYPKGRWWEEPADEYYHQAHASRRFND